MAAREGSAGSAGQERKLSRRAAIQQARMLSARLNDPFSRGRWGLIGVHVALILAGLAMIGTSL